MGCVLILCHPQVLNLSHFGLHLSDVVSCCFVCFFIKIVMGFFPPLLLFRMWTGPSGFKRPNFVGELSIECPL